MSTFQFREGFVKFFIQKRAFIKFHKILQISLINHQEEVSTFAHKRVPQRVIILVFLKQKLHCPENATEVTESAELRKKNCPWNISSSMFMGF